MLHLGNLLPILSADVIARYYRLKGNDVVFVSGSDEHGTPIEVEAIKQGIAPRELTDKNHRSVASLLREWQISFDNYTRTESPVHKEFVQDFFRKVDENGYIFTEETGLLYCLKDDRFLPDRFVEGKCPYCDYDRARGDQCEQCGRLLEPTRLLDPHCAICGTVPTLKTVTHWYFDMPRFTEHLQEYIEKNEYLPDNARNFSLNLLKEGLKPRPITRDNKWGIPAPFNGAEDKTIYVWFDAVLGYISATIEYFKEREDPEEWREYWFNKNVKTLYFIGKDNIPFHTLILPALLLATKEDYNLPWNVITNEFLIFAGQKSSKSRRVGVWIDEALELFPLDYWRYTLISIRPETKDSDFTWSAFIEKVNADLNDTLGNFIHRTLKFVNIYFKGEVPEPKDLRKLDVETLRLVRKSIDKTDENLKQFQLQVAIKEIIEIARTGNKYLNEKKPWEETETNLQEAANTIYVVVEIVKVLSILLEPFTPCTAAKIRNYLNLSNDPGWEEVFEAMPVGHKIKEVEPLFSKIEKSEEDLEDMIEKVRSRLKKFPIEDFSKLDIRIGKILSAEPISKSQNLIKLLIDVGSDTPKIAVAGIAKYYKPEELEGHQIAVITNLEPRRLFGVESQVMILAAQDKEIVVFLQPEKLVKPGSKVS